MRIRTTFRCLVSGVAFTCAIIACSDDQHSASQDGGPSEHDGASAAGRSNAAGGASGGGKSGAGATSGTGATSGASAGGTTSVMDASTDAASGSASDGGQDSDASAQHDAAKVDGSDGTARLCPLGSSFPVGTYYLDVMKGDMTADNQPVGSEVTPARSCEMGNPKAGGVLEITLSDPQIPNAYDLRFSADLQPAAGFGWSFEQPVEQNGKLHFHDSPSLEAGTLDFDIDEQTGVITGLYYEADHSLGSQESEYVFSAVGWPQCAATSASRPKTVPEPSVPSFKYCNDPSGSGTVSVGPGCIWAYYYVPNAAQPPCDAPGSAEQDAGHHCTCKNLSDGYESDCCPP